MKFKKIQDEYFITILDRLTRFTPANIRYKRVFDDVIQKYSQSEKIKNITIADNINLAVGIINSSLDKNYDNNDIYNVLDDIEEKNFKYNSISKQYISSKLNYKGMLDKIILNEETPLNVRWLKEISNNINNISNLRKEKSLLYPIEKIILCEGQTEYTLLETLFKLFDIDFKKEGIIVIPAGGKNQVARKYYSMCEIYNTRIFVLLDSDAIQIKTIIDKKLRKKDKLYLIKTGEFEDLIPYEILTKTINSIYKNELNCKIEDFSRENKNVENLEIIYKKYGFGEFKKARFASWLNEFIKNNCTSDDFNNSEIKTIIETFKN